MAYRFRLDGSAAPSGGSRCAGLALVSKVACLLALASPFQAARAHAPLAREVALSKEGGVAAALPGFGLILRSTEDAEFLYVCDALLGAGASEGSHAMAFRGDGALLVAGSWGMRVLDERGCPRAAVPGELRDASVVALAQRPDDPDRIYAIVDAPEPVVVRSENGGDRWRTYAPFAAASTASSFVVDEDETLFVGETSPDGGGRLWVSSDAAAGFEAHPQDQARTLVAVGPAGAWLWAVARPATAVGERLVTLQRADSAAGPWQNVQTVQYFGGLVFDELGTLWLGDEAGGLWRSLDLGESFERLQPDVPIACLAAHSGGLWACLPGAPSEPALVHWADAEQPSDMAVRLDDVQRMPECGEALDTEALCASAWAEWQRDVRGLAPGEEPTRGSDAGSARDAEATPGEGSATMGPSAGCAASRGAPDPWVALPALFALVTLVQAARGAPRPRARAGYER